MHSKSHRLSGSSVEGSTANPVGFKRSSTLCRVEELSQMRPLRPEASPKAVLKGVRTFKAFKPGNGANWEKNMERSKEAQDHNLSDKRWGARLLTNGKRTVRRIAPFASLCTAYRAKGEESVNSTRSSRNVPRIGFELMRVQKSSKMPLTERVCNFGPNDDQKDEKSGWRS